VACALNALKGKEKKGCGCGLASIVDWHEQNSINSKVSPQNLHHSAGDLF